MGGMGKRELTRGVQYGPRANKFAHATDQVICNGALAQALELSNADVHGAWT